MVLDVYPLCHDHQNEINHIQSGMKLLWVVGMGWAPLRSVFSKWEVNSTVSLVSYHSHRAVQNIPRMSFCDLQSCALKLISSHFSMPQPLAVHILFWWGWVCRFHINPRPCSAVFVVLSLTEFVGHQPQGSITCVVAGDRISSFIPGCFWVCPCATMCIKHVFYVSSRVHWCWAAPHLSGTEDI